MSGRFAKPIFADHEHSIVGCFGVSVVKILYDPGPTLEPSDCPTIVGSINFCAKLIFGTPFDVALRQFSGLYLAGDGVIFDFIPNAEPNDVRPPPTRRALLELLSLDSVCFPMEFGFE